MTHTNQMDILRQYIYPLQREQAAHVVEQYIGGTFLLRASSQPWFPRPVAAIETPMVP